MATLGRFVIRDLNPWEGPGVFALTGDANVMRYMGFATHQSVDDATKLIQLYRETPAKYQAVALQDSPADILGLLGLEVRGHQATMTIMFRRDWKARGVGRELCIPFVRWVFTHENIWRVWSYCHVDNVPVQNLLAKMGARQEGRLNRFEFFPNLSPEPQDCYVYAITR